MRGTLRTSAGTKILSLGTSKAIDPGAGATLVGPQGKPALEGSWTLQKAKWKDGNTGSLATFELVDLA